MTYKHSAGFTLMELLIVLAILVALFALLLPAVFNQQKKWNDQRAAIQINSLEAQIEQYAIENNGYPTTEQGLYALIFIPDNIGNSAAILQPGMPQQGMGIPTGMPGIDEQTGGMAGGAISVGPEMLNNSMNQQNPQILTGMSGMETTGMSPMTDPTGMGGGIVGSGMGTSTWTQPFHNPQLYTMQKKRSTPYIGNVKELTDPWGQPYRYDNTLAYFGVNQTGLAKPAIWSAGPDKMDGTDDDIRNWKPADAQKAFAERQQSLQMQQSGMGTGMMGMGNMDPTNSMMQQFGSGQTMPPMPTSPGGTGMPPMPIQ